MKLLIAGIVLFVQLANITEASETVEQKVMGHEINITGEMLRALSVAKNIFCEYKLNLEDYNVGIINNTDNYEIVFTHKEAKANQRGSSSLGVGVEIQIDKTDYSVLHKQLSR